MYRDLVEMNDNRKAALGAVLPKSALKDPHIQKIINYISKEGKVPVSEVEEELMHEFDELSKMAKKSPMLFGAMLDNVFEKALFKMFAPKEIRDPQDDVYLNKAGKEAQAKGEKLDKSKHGAKRVAAPQPKNAPQFDASIFTALVRRIQVENWSIFPLRNLFNRKPIRAPRFILVPSSDAKDQAEYGDIDTAAATHKGEFIFNKHFMQQCLNYAHVREVKPKSGKYENNGGKFPPEYSLIEFLILHEFFHYTHADFHYQEVIVDYQGKKALPKIINWVGDFRSNYDLVKSGHEPIPMGLYNHNVNYDQMASYKEMYDTVKRELMKLKDAPKVGDVVKHSTNGTHHVVTGVDENTRKVKTRIATQQEIDAAKKGDQLSGISSVIDKSAVGSVSTPNSKKKP